jgi:hypothetical protein
VCPCAIWPDGNVTVEVNGWKVTLSETNPAIVEVLKAEKPRRGRQLVNG